MKERFKTMVPMGRIGKPEEIASAAVFLASDELHHWNRFAGRRRPGGAV
jgi:NAD(P)-dependent dehydrogenase (short-subunit alcohol dehydrogenase family)